MIASHLLAEPHVTIGECPTGRITRCVRSPRLFLVSVVRRPWHCDFCRWWSVRPEVAVGFLGFSITPRSRWNGGAASSVGSGLRRRDAIVTLPVQGASIIEVGPVHVDDVAALRSATAGRTCPVIAYVDDPELVESVAPCVDTVTVGPSPDAVRLTNPGIENALAALADPDTTVLCTPTVLLAAGPGWFNRVIEAATPTSPAPGLRDVPRDPRRWPAWFWGVLVGVGMIVAGLGAAAIALGPVLLFPTATISGYLSTICTRSTTTWWTSCSMTGSPWPAT